MARGRGRRRISHSKRAKLVDLYLRKLESIGFSHFGTPIVVKNRKELEVYQLLYATRADLGVQIWNDCTKKPQLAFDF